MTDKTFTNGSTALQRLQAGSPNWEETLPDAAGYIKNKPTIPTTQTYYTAAGVANTPTKIWTGLITPNTGSGYSVDISAAGFLSLASISLTVVKNTSTAASVPRATVKTGSLTTITLNIVDSDTAAFVSTGVSLFLRVEGY